MSRYTSDSKVRVRDAVDMVALVSARTDLRRAGPNSYEGLCPFHDERTPSFSVEPVQKVYYCFGCEAKGDAFTFVQETEGVDFKGALELLADRSGVELQVEAEDPREAQRRQQRERLLELLGRTAAYYERHLWESTEAKNAREYLEGRGLGEEILRSFHVGYSPSAWDRVLVGSRRAGFSEQELYVTGLAQRSKQDRRLYDRFRGRIMFPLADIRGRVLGFGARAMRDEQGPKYLNTSDNDVYHKGQHLYGADLARLHATRAGEVLLCEGYTDVIALHQAGMQNAVGLMGTALTAEQVGELARMASRVLLALDADSAGQEAMLRASKLATSRKLELRVVEMPEGADPADLVQREGVEAMNAAVAKSVPFVRFRVERVLAQGDYGSPEGRDRTIEELRPVFATMPPSAMRMELTRLVSGRLELPESVVERELSVQAANAAAQRSSGESRTATGTTDATTAPAAAATTTAKRPVSRALGRREETERTFLVLCLASPQEGAQALAELDLDGHFTSDLLRRAAEHLRAGDLREPMKSWQAQESEQEHDGELEGVLAELVVQAGREEGRPAMLRVQLLQLELARVDRQIQAARVQGLGDVSELARRRGDVKREFDRAQEQALEETGE
ncbi:MAG TPA: DNA primase [Solirubrobacteraceae bacterium]